MSFLIRLFPDAIVRNLYHFGNQACYLVPQVVHSFRILSPLICQGTSLLSVHIITFRKRELVSLSWSWRCHHCYTVEANVAGIDVKSFFPVGNFVVEYFHGDADDNPPSKVDIQNARHAIERSFLERPKIFRVGDLGLLQVRRADRPVCVPLCGYCSLISFTSFAVCL